MPKKYFIRANTSSGLVSFAENNLDGINRLYVLDGTSKSVKTRIMELTAECLSSLKLNAEYAKSPFNPDQFDAVISREAGFAVVDGCCTNKGTHINTDISLKGDFDTPFIQELLLKANSAYSLLYDSYNKAKIIHDEWEKMYIDNINFDNLNTYGDELIDTLIGDKKGSGHNVSFERFFGASTVDGSMNFIDNLTENLSYRYFIKGRPGTGKSTFLKKLNQRALKQGFDTEVYYCSFDKLSLDMVIVPELSFCVFDSTSPHEMFPQGDRDSILDFYVHSSLVGTDEKYAPQFRLISTKYKHRILEGLAHLRLGNLFMAEREFYLSHMADDAIISEIAESLTIF